MKLRAKERRKKAEEAANKMELEIDRIKGIEDDIYAQREGRDTVMRVITGASILLVIWILNV